METQRIRGCSRIFKDLSMKYHYVYRITNIVNNRHYYRKRTSWWPPLLDIANKYFSSSSDLSFIKEQYFHPERFVYKVVKTFETALAACLFERALHIRFDVSRSPNFYNKIIASGLLCRTERVSAKDQDGNLIAVPKDTFDRSDDLFGVRFGICTVYKDDFALNILSLDKEEFLADGWTTWMSGKTIYRDEEGNGVILSAEEAALRNLVGVCAGKLPVYDLEGNRFSVSLTDSRLHKTIFPFVNSPGTTTYKDSEGNRLRLATTDPRVLSGELVGNTKGYKHTNEHKRLISDIYSSKTEDEKNELKTSTSLILVYNREMELVLSIDTKFDDLDAEFLKISTKTLPYKKYMGMPMFYDLENPTTRGATISVGKLNSSFPDWRDYIGFTIKQHVFKSRQSRINFKSNENSKYLKDKQ